MNEGYKWLVDIDLASYFDTVNHDKLIGLIYREVKDIRVISLIRKYLNAGVMINGIVTSTEIGVPQGGLCYVLHKPPNAQCLVMRSNCAHVPKE